MVKLQDISIFFKSNCCNADSKSGDSPLSELSKSTGIDHVRTYFELLLNYNPNIDIYVTTIIIGNKYYGKMSSDDQYKSMLQSIKRHTLFHGEADYVYCFEYTSSGVVHAHGLTTVSQALFEESFYKYGKRNIHKDSFQKLGNFKEYFNYMTKDISNNPPGKPCHNITKRKLTELRARVREGFPNESPEAIQLSSKP